MMNGPTEDRQPNVVQLELRKLKSKKLKKFKENHFIWEHDTVIWIYIRNQLEKRYH